MMKKIIRLPFIIKYTVIPSIFLLLTSCTKLVEVDAPITSTSGANVYLSDPTASAVLTGIYTSMSKGNFSFSGGGITSLSFFPSLSADELELFKGVSNSTLIAYYRNSLSSINTSGSDFWRIIYPVIYYSNAAITGLNASDKLTPKIKQELLGEAKFIRAFCYFYLINLYGDVPLIINGDWQQNLLPARTKKELVWEQIVLDLKEAQVMLSAVYLNSNIISETDERVRPTKWAASALLARVYLYKSDWINAALNATISIDNTNLFGLDSLNAVFVKNSKEAIWQLQPVGIGINSNTGEGRLFNLPKTGPSSSLYPVYLSNNFLNSFESNDQRKDKWTNRVVANGTTYVYPYKYKIGRVNTALNEYIMVLRLAEQFLIRAEARVHQNDITGALQDLNAIRNRAGLDNLNIADKSQLLAAISHERRIELFTEWGDRWFDLKRTGKVDSIMSIITANKQGSWNSNWQLYPIPLVEMQKDPALKQNEGYN